MRVILKETPPNTYSPRAHIVTADGSQVLGEVHWVAGYGDPKEAERRAEAVARAHRFAASDRMLSTLRTARDLLSEAIETHIYGDGDEISEDCGYHAGLREIDAAIAVAEGRDLVPTPVLENDSDDEEVDDNPFHSESPEGRAWDRGEFKKD